MRTPKCDNVIRNDKNALRGLLNGCPALNDKKRRWSSTKFCEINRENSVFFLNKLESSPHWTGKCIWKFKLFLPCYLSCNKKPKFYFFLFYLRPVVDVFSHIWLKVGCASKLHCLKNFEKSEQEIALLNSSKVGAKIVSFELHGSILWPAFDFHSTLELWPFLDFHVNILWSVQWISGFLGKIQNNFQLLVFIISIIEKVFQTSKPATKNSWQRLSDFFSGKDGVSIFDLMMILSRIIARSSELHTIM